MSDTTRAASPSHAVRYTVCSAANAHLVMDDVGCRVMGSFPTRDAADEHAQLLNERREEAEAAARLHR